MVSRVLVVGSGCIGLRTALELTRKGISVVLRSPVHPLDPSNCSQGAGGLWMPVYCDDPRVGSWGIQTLDEIYPLAEDAKNPLVDLRYVLSLKRKHEGPGPEDFVAEDYHRGTGGKSLLPFWSSDPRFKFQNATLEQVAWQNQIHQLRLPSLSKAQAAGYNHAWFFQTPVVDCPNMLEHFLDQLKKSSDTEEFGDADVDVETGVYYQSEEELFEEAKNFGCDAIVNCTGMGASELCGDSELVGARGVLLKFDRSSCKRLDHNDDKTLFGGSAKQLYDACVFADEAPWGTPDLPSYMIVRGDDIVIGGTCLKGDIEKTVRTHERTRLLETARLLGIDTTVCQPKEEWVGFRPFRQTIRCEVGRNSSKNPAIDDSDHSIRLVHCYGTGGSGWTIYTGLAKEATRLVLQQC